jgi:hypothetical protein
LEWFFGTEEEQHDQNPEKFCGGQVASKRGFVSSGEFLFSDIPGKTGFCGRVKQASNTTGKLSRSRGTVSFIDKNTSAQSGKIQKRHIAKRRIVE